MPTRESDRRYAAVRATLITYGIAASTWLFTRAGLGSEARAFGVDASASTFLFSGLGLQFALIIAGLLIRRVIADQEMAAQALGIVELIADGVTVLLFAMATLGAIAHVSADL